MMNKIGHLVLADGSVFRGHELLGPEHPVVGEVVFSTATTGYAEILSDPSFYGQIVVLTNPEVGNYGVDRGDLQSSGIKIRGLVVRRLSQSSWIDRSHMSLRAWLHDESIPVLTGVDTRSLVIHIRDHGAMMAAMGLEGTQSFKTSLEAIRQAPTMADCRLSHLVSVQESKVFARAAHAKYHIVVMDFGVKTAILRLLENLGSLLTIVPGWTSFEEICALRPDGLCLSNGPGDPRTEIIAIKTVQKLLGTLPLFGICLGHQILAQALGLSTYKLRFGHRGSNQPVRISGGRIVVTAQNHGFGVNFPETPKFGTPAVNLADDTNEGLDLPELGVFSVQYHPEGAPGPRDSLDCFDKFARYIDAWKNSPRKHSV